MNQQPNPIKTKPASPATSLFAEHGRHWESFAYVYPVVSRRSRGLSIGINLNPDTICNFDCVYCQVDKLENPKPMPVDLHRLRQELGAMLQDVASGRIWALPRFAQIDPALKRLNDIAFSGDGEPTTAKGFTQAVDIAVELKNASGLDGIKLILITNATLLDRPHIESAIRVLDDNNGEVWAKLDAGTESYYKQVDRSAVPLRRVLDNLLACGKRRPIVIQSMFLNMHDRPMQTQTFDAYTDRLAELIQTGCQIKAVQLYTVARQPLEDYVSALTNEQLAELSKRLKRRLANLPDAKDITLEVFGGCD